MSHSMVSLRKAIGLESYEALKLTEAGVQKLISEKIDIPFVEPTGDLVPVKAEPTVINQNIANVNVDYKKLIRYGIVTAVGVLVVYEAGKFVYKKVKEKNTKDKEE